MISNLDSSLWNKAKNPLARRLEEVKAMREIIPPKATLEVHEGLDLWTFYDLSEASFVPCETLARFMQLLLSPGTRDIGITPNNPTKQCGVILYGPICDDVNGDTKQSERDGRLKAMYTLTADTIHDAHIGLGPDEQWLLVDTIRKKGRVDTTTLTQSLNLKRVL